MKTILPLLKKYYVLVLLALTILPAAGFSQDIDFGKTYFNVTKGVTGGTVEPNDIIEVRATFVVKNGAIADSCAFYDAVPLGTTYVANTLAILTNEAKTYKKFTDAAGDDCGRIVGTNITMNLGFNGSGAGDNIATPFRRGTVRASHRPSFYGGSCIMVASYRVKVTAAYGTVINIGGGSASYKIRGTAIVRLINFNSNKITVFNNYGICPNSVGGNTLGAEFNGTFGSGKTRNRGVSASVPGSYTYQVFDNSSPQDYNYGVANNTSTRSNYSTSNTWAKPDNSTPSHRVFSVWDIIGDHTNAVNPFIGNPAADTVVKDNGGYMLVINASYKTDSAFQHTVNNLCPNTYYEISAWFRNICSKCGCDSTGKGATGGPGYIPTAAGDSSGVYPSLTFDVNGSDYYSTGLLKYSGQWIKKGFTYLTGPTETSFVLTVKNNAPGGGGNDWAIDDIAVATCTPNLDMKPSPTVSVCYGNTVNMYCDVRCFFPNYTYYEWERSTDGVTWSATGVTGVGVPTMVSGQWQYTANYPPFVGDSSSHNSRYRIKIASSLANLSDPNCSFFASSLIQVYVNNCMQLLDLKLTSFNGKNENDRAKLAWTTENETNGNWFEIERSSDGTHFTTIAQAASNADASGVGRYAYPDPEIIEGTYYYRVKATDGTGYKYSRVVSVSNSKARLQMKSLVNPFESNITFDLQAPANAKAIINLFDAYGRMLKQKEVQLIRGINKISLNQLSDLPTGSYIIRVQSAGQVINERVIKATNKG